MFFGEKLKQLRLKKAEKGLRVFAVEAGMKARELHEIEQGFIPPPCDDKWIEKIVTILGIEKESSDIVELEHLFKAPFIMQKMSENIIPVFAGDNDGPLSKDRLMDLTNWMRRKAIEHNKKADQYNNEK